MTKFRKKPIVIEAFQFKGWTSSYNYMPRWFIGENGERPDGIYYQAIGANILYESMLPHPAIACIIKTLEGNMRADVGDWIIRGIKGEIYPCKPEIFAASYEPVDDREEADSGAYAVTTEEGSQGQGPRVLSSEKQC